MHRSEFEALQMHGQDIPWLLEHWATHKPDHPALVWDPPDGEGRQWSYAQLLEATRSIAAGLRCQLLRKKNGSLVIQMVRVVKIVLLPAQGV